MKLFIRFYRNLFIRYLLPKSKTIVLFSKRPGVGFGRAGNVQILPGPGIGRSGIWPGP